MQILLLIILFYYHILLAFLYQHRWYDRQQNQCKGSNIPLSSVVQ